MREWRKLATDCANLHGLFEKCCLFSMQDYGFASHNFAWKNNEFGGERL